MGVDHENEADPGDDAAPGNYSERPSALCRHCGERIVREDGYWFHERKPGSLLHRCQPPALYGPEAEPPDGWSIHGQARTVKLNGHPYYDSESKEWRTHELFFWPDGVVTWKPTR